MKTFEYLDSLVDVLLILDNIENAIMYWESKKYNTELDIYLSFLKEFNIGEESLEENYIYWSLRERLKKGSTYPPTLKQARAHLKNEGYT